MALGNKNLIGGLKLYRLSSSAQAEGVLKFGSSSSDSSKLIILNTVESAETYYCLFRHSFCKQ